MIPHFDWEHFWRQQGWVNRLLLPVAAVFGVATYVRKHCLLKRHRRSVPAMPVIVVGNISVGGNGKTPLLIELIKQLKNAGFKPGVISRGYRSQCRQYPKLVHPHADPQLMGDEPVLIAKRTQVPVVIDPKRVRALDYIAQLTDCDVVLADDGLQHYALFRHLEIAVIGSKQALGNQWLLPAGPLREGMDRLATVDWIMGADDIPQVTVPMKVNFSGLFRVSDDEPVDANFFKGKTVHAVTAIAQPQRFYQLLECLGIKAIFHSFPDHHYFKTSELQRFASDLVLMTEKDAVKCRGRANQRMYYLKIDVQLPPEFVMEFIRRVKKEGRNLSCIAG